MAQDDLVPDGSLIARLHAARDVVNDVIVLTAMRKHLPLRALTELSDHFGGAIAEIAAAVQPDDEINAKYRSRMRNEAIGCLSGEFFYIYDPQASEVRHVDIVVGLLHTCRFSGQLPRFLSVAEHSIKVAAITEHLLVEEVRLGNLHEDAVAPGTLYALLHDAHEAYMGDTPLPQERRLADVFGTPWGRIKQNVQDAIIEAYDLPPLAAEVDSIIHQADQYAFYFEVVALKSKDDHSRYNMLIPPPGVGGVGQCRKEEPNREQVRMLFDSEVRRLVNTIGARVPGGKANAPIVPKLEPHPAAQTLAEVMQNRPVPGERAPSPPHRESSEEYYPNLARPPLPSDVQATKWESAMRSTEVQIPPQLMDEPEFQGEA